MQEIHVTANEAGQRLDKLLAKFLREAPRSFLYKMLRKKNITLNGRKADGSEKLAQGDVIKLFLSEETIEKFSGSGIITVPAKPDMKPDIIYEDSHILLINKPVGMLSQKARENDISAVEYLTAYLLSSGQITERELKTFHPSICNRLDRNTSGILAAGKSLCGLQELSRFFKDRSIEKYYLCPVDGLITKCTKAKGFLTKNQKTNKVMISPTEVSESTPIETEYRPVASAANITLLEVHLITGKTHQIRAHLASAGHPVIGDYKYGNRKVNEQYRKQYGLTSQLLHAWRLVMPQTDGPLAGLSGREFRADVPDLFRRICKDKGVM